MFVRKCKARNKYYSTMTRNISDNEKGFITLTPALHIIEHYFFVIDAPAK
jgi:hypothetical protein